MEKIPIFLQPRHVHLTTGDHETLFGNEPLVQMEPLHMGQYICEQTVNIMGEHGMLENVRVFGPCREQTQVELSATDAYALGINAPVRLSGDLLRAGSCTLQGPCGEVRSTQSVIIPARHIHCSHKDAQRLGISQGQMICVVPVKRNNDRIDHITVRVHPTYKLSLHLTTDEAAIYWLTDKDHVLIN